MLAIPHSSYSDADSACICNFPFFISKKVFEVLTRYQYLPVSKVSCQLGIPFARIGVSVAIIEGVVVRNPVSEEDDLFVEVIVIVGSSLVRSPIGVLGYGDSPEDRTVKIGRGKAVSNSSVNDCDVMVAKASILTSSIEREVGVSIPVPKFRMLHALAVNITRQPIFKSKEDLVFIPLKCQIMIYPLFYHTNINL
jgi:hypothetical protein